MGTQTTGGDDGKKKEQTTLGVPGTSRETVVDLRIVRRGENKPRN